MPSEAAKKRQAQKRGKRQASSRSAQKRPTIQPSVEDGGQPVPQCRQNGELTNGDACPSVDGGATASGSSINEGIDRMKLSARSCTGECVLNLVMYIDTCAE